MIMFILSSSFQIIENIINFFKDLGKRTVRHHTAISNIVGFKL